MLPEGFELRSVTANDAAALAAAYGNCRDHLAPLDPDRATSPRTVTDQQESLRAPGWSRRAASHLALLL